MIIRISIIPLLLLVISGFALAEEDNEDDKLTLTPEELEEYQFQPKQDVFMVNELTVGQLQILKTKRLLAKDLLARKLGILSVQGRKSDLDALQRLIDGHFLRKEQVDEWQALGVLFGDVVVKQQGLKWVRYEDELGISKALRWRATDNFVFPITIFSKRIKYGEEINVTAIYDQLELDIAAFKKWELRPKLPNAKKAAP